MQKIIEYYSIFLPKAFHLTLFRENHQNKAEMKLNWIIKRKAEFSLAEKVSHGETRIRNFQRVDEFFLFTQKRIKRFNKSHFKTRKVKRRATSSENKKFVAVVVKSTLGIVMADSRNCCGHMLALQDQKRLWQLCKVGRLVMDLGTCCLIHSSKH